MNLPDDLQDILSILLVEVGLGLDLGHVDLHKALVFVQLLVHVFLHLSNALLQFAHLGFELIHSLIVVLLILLELVLNARHAFVKFLLDTVDLSLSVALKCVLHFLIAELECVQARGGVRSHLDQRLQHFVVED